MASPRLNLPWTKSPLIINAPMGGFATGKLAVAVSNAGGFGFIGATIDWADLSRQLEEVDHAFRASPPSGFDSNSSSFLPIGVGFLCHIAKLESVVQTLQKSPKPPAVVWLFAAPDDPSPLDVYTRWAEAIRQALPSPATPQIWIQAGGSVAYILSVAQSAAKPDAICIQGTDAGGHGPESGASLLSLLPETLDKLRVEGLTELPVLAAGGIVDGRSAAAAFALGAAGVVMGTRFLAAAETKVHKVYRERILAAQDGAAATVRAKVFDELRGPNSWPAMYDGRALVSASWRDMKSGKVSAEEIVKRHGEAIKGEDAGFAKDTDRAAIWAGTGVGQVHKVQPADEIVNEVRDGVMKTLEDLRARL